MRDGQFGRRSVVGGMAAVTTGLVLPRRGRAATRIVLGYTATLGFNGAFIAKDRGFFSKHGLDVDLVLVTLNSNLPGALMGGSIQIGGPTPTVFLQADDGGIDLVTVAGCAGIDPENKTDGLLARVGLPISKAADLVGRKVGVPGLNAYYHVMTRLWLTQNGVDPGQVTFVEVPFTQSADVLRSGSVDVVATGEPFSVRIVKEGIGKLLVPMSAIAPGGTPTLFYTATRDWANANMAAMKAFAAALGDAIAFQKADPDGARASASKFIHLPPEVMATTTLPLLQDRVQPSGLQFWIDVMTKQGMLQDKPDVGRLIAG